MLLTMRAPISAPVHIPSLWFPTLPSPSSWKSTSVATVYLLPIHPFPFLCSQSPIPKHYSVLFLPRRQCSVFIQNQSVPPDSIPLFLKSTSPPANPPAHPLPCAFLTWESLSPASDHESPFPPGFACPRSGCHLFRISFRPGTLTRRDAAGVQGTSQGGSAAPSWTRGQTLPKPASRFPLTDRLHVVIEILAVH